MEYGFEREFFVMNKSSFVLCPPNVPHDDCGYLAESRGEPHKDPLKAAYLLLAEEERMRNLLPSGYKLVLKDTIELSPELLRAALRQYGKNAATVEQGSLYKLEYAADDKLNRAGLHVHFSNIRNIENKNGVVERVPQIINMPALIQKLDAAFEKEISEAKRLPGLYEMKAHGFEYRSLPASVDVRKVAAVLLS